MTQPIRRHTGDIVHGKDEWTGIQEITVWPDGYLEIRGAYAYRLYYYLWNWREISPSLIEKTQREQRLSRRYEERELPPLGDLTSLLRHAEPTDNVLPVIREGMKSLLALKNIEVTNKNMPSNSSIPIRLRLAAHNPRLAQMNHAQPETVEDDLQPKKAKRRDYPSY